MKFSVVTASHNQLGWLRCAMRSVADQEGIATEQIIQDAGTPGINELTGPGVAIHVESDTGMYDALNRGLARATGDVVSILNCDEQYLPGALAKVARLFEQDPQADMVVGDCLITNAEGELLCFRRSTPLRPAMVLIDHLYDFTCAIFFRRRLMERQIRFNPAFKAAGDAEWIARLLRSGVRVRYLREYLGVFALTGENLSMRAESEAALLRASTPGWARIAAPLLRGYRHLEKLVAGGYASGPIRYAIHTGGQDRTEFVCEKPSFKHPWS